MYSTLHRSGATELSKKYLRRVQVFRAIPVGFSWMIMAILQVYLLLEWNILDCYL